MARVSFCHGFRRNLHTRPSLTSWLRIWNRFCDICLRSGATAPQSWSQSRNFARGSDRLYGENTKMALTSQGGQILSRDRCTNLFHQISHKKHFCQKRYPPFPQKIKVAQNFTSYPKHPGLGVSDNFEKFFHFFPSLALGHRIFRLSQKWHRKFFFLSDFHEIYTQDQVWRPD